MQCVEELTVPGVLPVFVQVGVESTLERSQITRDHMGQLLYQLVQSEKLSKEDFFKGLVVCGSSRTASGCSPLRCGCCVWKHPEQSPRQEVDQPVRCFSL